MNRSAQKVYPAPVDLEEAQQIRREAPIARVSMPTGNEVWMVMSHELVREALVHPAVGRAPLVQSENVPYRAKFPSYLKNTLLFTDDPEHARLRRAVQKWFSPRQIRAMRGEIEAECERLLDEMQAQGGPVDIVSEYAVPLPIFALVRVLGADPSMTADFLRWNQVLFGIGEQDQAHIDSVIAECEAYLRQELALKRGSDGQDMLSVLANLPEGEDRLSDDEVISLAVLVLVAGFDNTANFIGNGILALLRQPEQLQYLLEDLDGRLPVVVEELLRHGRQSVGSGVQNTGMPFIALEDLELGGAQIRAGELIVANRNAGNHDEEVFAEPLVLDVSRETNPHLTFSYGTHSCLGAPLARLELHASLSALFRRFPTIQVVGSPEYQKHTMSEAIERLTVLLGSEVTQGEPV